MASIVGTWIMTTDWGCDGSISGSWDHTFNADGTWTASTGDSGRWFQAEGMFSLSADDLPNLIYSGNVSGSWIAGIQGYTDTSGMKGCFGGVRSTAGAKAKAAEGKGKAINPATGK